MVLPQAVSMKIPTKRALNRMIHCEDSSHHHTDAQTDDTSEEEKPQTPVPAGTVLPKIYGVALLSRDTLEGEVIDHYGKLARRHLRWFKQIADGHGGAEDSVLECFAAWKKDPSRSKEPVVIEIDVTKGEGEEGKLTRNARDETWLNVPLTSTEHPDWKVGQELPLKLVEKKTRTEEDGRVKRWWELHYTLTLGMSEEMMHLSVSIGKQVYASKYWSKNWEADGEFEEEEEEEYVIA
ncbi:uncharacterized protein RCC_03457 [Ramularia collo-cygni]|uniref:Uncharacterized protein n=1 Tax=Ramularia collo-cygni TaxID=112498 RepID=A0A2D3UWU6_9PEZI|nr:uncharacterized protein RCC_03457 [Ramularia collo-cygni]CZT17620.1 uncharacterized protein RCC_03457 [Ramularia collo-cygni]